MLKNLMKSLDLLNLAEEKWSLASVYSGTEASVNMMPLTVASNTKISRPVDIKSVAINPPVNSKTYMNSLTDYLHNVEIEHMVVLFLVVTITSICNVLISVTYMNSFTYYLYNVETDL